MPYTFPGTAYGRSVWTAGPKSPKVYDSSRFFRQSALHVFRFVILAESQTHEKVALTYIARQAIDRTANGFNFTG